MTRNTIPTSIGFKRNKRGLTFTCEQNLFCGLPEGSESDWDGFGKAQNTGQNLVCMWVVQLVVLASV